MSRAIFLANPDLNIDDVEVTHSSALGRRADEPVAGPANYGGMDITAIGDTGDGIDRQIRLRGSDNFPRYFPTNSAGAEMSTAMETFTTLPTLAVSAVKRLALVTCYDRLFLVTLTGTDGMAVYVYTGPSTGWSLRASVTVDHAIQGGIGACARGDNIYITVADESTNTVSVYRFNAKSYRLGEIAEDIIAVNAPTAISIASDGALFVFLHEYDLGGGLTDVRVAYGGDLAKDFRQKAHSFLDMFDGDWTAQGNVDQPMITWNSEYGFIAAMMAGVDAPRKIRVARSKNGEDWSEFVDITGGTISYPTTTLNTGNVKNLGLAAEGRRLFTFRGITSGALDAAPTGMRLQYFNGRQAWSAEIAAAGGLDLLNGTGIAAANWRGTIYLAWASDASTIQTRKCNTLSTLPSSTAGHSTRSIERGDRNFVDGIEDDSRTALWFNARGTIVKDDTFTIPVGYDRRGANVLSEVLSETWRASDNGAEWVKFDAGLDRAFSVDTLAVFGSNLPSLTLELDDDPDFAAPPVSQAVSATITTAAVVDGDRSILTFAAGTFEHYQHAETTRWVKLDTGVAGIFRVLDNTETTLVVDGDVTGAGGTATIFGDRMWHFFDAVQTPYRYLRLVTPTLEVPDGYYEIGRVIFGARFLLPRNFSSGFTRQIAAVESPLQLKSGPRIVTSLNVNHRDTFALPWQVIKHEIGLASLKGFYGRVNGAVGQMAFWPHPSSPVVDQVGAYLCRVDQPLQLQHLNARYFSGGLVLGSEV